MNNKWITYLNAHLDRYLTDFLTDLAVIWLIFYCLLLHIVIISNCLHSRDISAFYSLFSILLQICFLGLQHLYPQFKSGWCLHEKSVLKFSVRFFQRYKFLAEFAIYLWCDILLRNAICYLQQREKGIYIISQLN